MWCSADGADGCAVVGYDDDADDAVDVGVGAMAVVDDADVDVGVGVIAAGDDVDAGGACDVDVADGAVDGDVEVGVAAACDDDARAHVRVCASARARPRVCVSFWKNFPSVKNSLR